MSIPRSVRRTAQVCVIACALIAPTASASDPLAQERYYMSQPAGVPAQGSVPQEQYYSSYGEPQPLSAPQPAPASNDTPWLPIVLSVALAVAVATVGASRLQRVRVRRRAEA